jgi:hypothetical protein
MCRRISGGEKDNDFFKKNARGGVSLHRRGGGLHFPLAKL